MYEYGASTKTNTFVVSLFYLSLKDAARVIDPIRYVIFPANPIKGKFTCFRSFLDFLMTVRASIKSMFVELPEFNIILFAF